MDPRWNAWIWVATLAAMFAVTYLDRLSTAGMLLDMQRTFGINDAQSGFVLTAYIVFYTLFAPLFGYAADRRDRRHVIALGIAIWSASVLATVFVSSSQFYLFLLLRGIGGIGEASFSVCLPTLVADSFKPSKRSLIIMIILLSMPVGIGIGYAYGAGVPVLLGHWQRSFYIPPIIGAAIVLTLLCILREPREFTGVVVHTAHDPYLDVLASLMRCKSFMFLTVGNAMSLLAIGGVTWFIPAMFIQATCLDRNISDAALLEPVAVSQIGLIFGAVATFGGIASILVGVWLSEIWKRGRFCFIASHRVDAYILAISVFAAAPLMSLAYGLLPRQIGLAWMCIAGGLFILGLSWTIVVNFIMLIVPARHCNIAMSWFMLFGHLFGDGTGPVIVGAISDALRGAETTPAAAFRSLIVPFHAMSVLLAISGVIYLASAYTAVGVDEEGHGNGKHLNKERRPSRTFGRSIATIFPVDSQNACN